jgi:hypothetical protein|tara:strand:- start:383 stop:625 length:243 start_codon:yes stop_codon:yes gene_type:complete
MSSREIQEAKGFGDRSKIQERLNEVTKEMIGYPDAKKHQVVSFIKSAIRIVGYCLIPINLFSAAIVLVLSEVVGIIEELV